MTDSKIKNIFGDDGFRCKYGEKYLTKKFLSNFAISIGKYYKKKYKKPKCIIGIDTRKTGPKIFKIISRELLNLDVDVHYCGVIPSPGISFVLSKYNFHFGIMITASHNSFGDNGIKLFNNQGFKLNFSDEKKIEVLIRKNLKKKGVIRIKRKNYRYYPFENSDYRQKYFEFLKRKINPLIIEKKVIIDCSNGASSYLINKLFKKTKNVVIINNKPNGVNINLNCGSLHTKKLQKILIKKNYDFALALDGDSDRCVLVDKNNGLIASEKVIFLFLKILNKKKSEKTICSSEIVNKALELNLSRIGYSLLQTKVGDRNVINHTKKKGAIIGFEPSGHFYFPNLNNSMDGNLSILLILNYLKKYAGNFDKILKLNSHKRIIENIKISSTNIPLYEIKKKLSKFKLLSHEKLLIRQSIWDPIYRVYYDYNSINRFAKIKKILLNK